jgi:hypothetical protein
MVNVDCVRGKGGVAGRSRSVLMLDTEEADDIARNMGGTKEEVDTKPLCDGGNDDNDCVGAMDTDDGEPCIDGRLGGGDNVRCAIATAPVAEVADNAKSEGSMGVVAVNNNGDDEGNACPGTSDGR